MHAAWHVPLSIPVHDNDSEGWRFFHAMHAVMQGIDHAMEEGEGSAACKN